MAARNAIAVGQFAENLRLAWSGAKGALPYSRQGFVAGIPRRVGLAISGGADSMALAYLCRELEKAPVNGPFSVTAFIVDHRARPESTDEAKTVRDWLSELGVNTEILTVDWTQLSKSYKELTDNADKTSKPTAFETYARQLRFQALGKACYQRELEALLLGHHQDDTVETVMWRLSNGAPRPGLNGIQSLVRIPECHGIFGVSESGSSITIPESKKGKMSSKTKVATGGIYLCRPLLSFPKSQLLATCHENNIPYVSDPTNFDPTLTARNAIRGIISGNSLPRALQAPRILALIESSRELVNSANDLSDKILSTQSRILDMDLRAGTLTIEFDYPTSAMNQLMENISPEKFRQIQCLSLRRITDLVSPMPYNHFPLHRFEPFVSHVFGKPVPASHLRSPFTVGGVMFTPVESSGSEVGSESQLSTTARVWRLSRRPFSKKEVSSTFIEVPLPQRRNSDWEPGLGEWVLWDNRYWFRLSLAAKMKGTEVPAAFDQTKGISFQIRHFQEKDYLAICDSARRGNEKNQATVHNLRSLFADRAPGKTRMTIPTITYEDSSDPSAKGRLLALPTFDFDLSKNSDKRRARSEVEILHNGVPMILKWSWMFRMIDIDVLRLMDRPVEAEAAIVQ